MGSVAIRNRMMQNNGPHELLLPLAYDPDNNFFFNDDRTLGFGFEMDPLAGADISTIDKTLSLLKQDFPTDTFIQFILYASPDVQRFTKVIENNARIRPGDSDLQKLCKSALTNSKNFIEDHIENPLHDSYIRDFRLIMTVKFPTSAEMVTEKDHEYAKKVQQGMIGSLKTIGFHTVRPLDAEGYLRFMQTIVNWTESPRWKNHEHLYDDNELINTQVFDFDSALKRDSKGMWLGSKRVKTMSVKRYPNAAYMPANFLMLGDLKNATQAIKENFMITATLYYPNREKAKQKVETKRQRVNYVAFGKMTKFMPHIQMQKASFDKMQDVLEEGDRPVQFSLNVMVFADSEDKAVAAVDGARTYYSTLGYQFMEDKYFAQPIFLNSLPFNIEKSAIRELHRFKTYATRHVVHLLPILGDWKGTATAVMHFFSRNWQLVPFDIYDSPTSYGVAISAESGSGKSFLTNYIITRYLAIGGRAWVIDIGRSYLKLCKAFGGQFITFDEESDICLNPFDIVENYEDEEDILLGLLSVMAMPTETMSDYQSAELRRITATAFKEFQNKLNIDIIAKELASHADQRIRDLGVQLHAFTTLGAYGKYFNGKNNVSFNNPFIVLELEELKSKPTLQKAILFMLMYQIQQTMYVLSQKNPALKAQPKLTIVDECWQLLSGNDEVAAFLEAGYRRARKVNGSFSVVTQSIFDLYKNAAGEAIAENSPIKLLLGQQAETIDKIKKQEKISMSDGGYELLKTVHTVPGKYSEVYVHSPMGKGIVRLIVDRFSQLLYSTHPREVAAIESRTNRGLSMPEAIMDVMREEGMQQ